MAQCPSHRNDAKRDQRCDHANGYPCLFSFLGFAATICRQRHCTPVRRLATRAALGPFPEVAILPVRYEAPPYWLFDAATSHEIVITAIAPKLLASASDLTFCVAVGILVLGDGISLSRATSLTFAAGPRTIDPADHDDWKSHCVFRRRRQPGYVDGSFQDYAIVRQRADRRTLQLDSDRSCAVASPPASSWFCNTSTEKRSRHARRVPCITMLRPLDAFVYARSGPRPALTISRRSAHAILET